MKSKKDVWMFPLHGIKHNVLKFKVFKYGNICNNAINLMK